MTSPRINEPGDKPDQSEEKLAKAVATIDAQEHLIRFLKDMNRELPPVVQALREQVEYEEQIERLERELTAKHSVCSKQSKHISALKGQRTLNENDRMANVCRLATAALSHIDTFIIEDDEDHAPFKGGHEQLEAAVSLLKPLATGTHGTWPWGHSTLCDVNVLPNLPVDPSMGDDPWNEWVKRRPKVHDNTELWTEWVNRQPKIQDNTDYMDDEAFDAHDKEKQYQQLLNMISFLAKRVQALEEKES